MAIYIPREYSHIYCGFFGGFGLMITLLAIPDFIFMWVCSIGCIVSGFLVSTRYYKGKMLKLKYKQCIQSIVVGFLLGLSTMFF